MERASNDLLEVLLKVGGPIPKHVPGGNPGSYVSSVQAVQLAITGGIPAELGLKTQDPINIRHQELRLARSQLAVKVKQCLGGFILQPGWQAQCLHPIPQGLTLNAGKHVFEDREELLLMLAPEQLGQQPNSARHRLTSHHAALRPWMPA